MVELQEARDELQQVGVQVVGISYDPVATLKEFSDSTDISFPLLSDKDSRTIHEYGLHFEGGLPHPGTLLIGPDGTVRARLFVSGYRDRHTVDDLVAAAKASQP